MTVAAEPTTRRFTRDEYHRMAEMGMFDGQRVELIHGEIITMSPQNNPHALTVAIITGWLVRGLGENFTVRCQLPVVASDDTEPEPDFAVLAGSPESQREHPTTALLMIEVADSSVTHDRRKGDIYASRGVQDYWIVNLRDRQLEVYRNPVPSSESETGTRYSSKSILTLEQSIAPVGLPLAAVKVSRLFPVLH
jgi:Uma2 family endonuclease